jgi:hypothetical protein
MKDINENLKNLNLENYIKLCKLRLGNMDRIFTEISIEDSSFKYFDGVAFIIKSNECHDYRYSFHFDVFYPNEFMYLLSIGVEF